MIKIYLVRHGQDKDNVKFILNGRRNYGLTDLGKKQAKSAGKKLKKEKIDLIFSSPLKRATQTAKIIAKEIGIKNITIDDRLIERDFGVLTGKKIADIEKYGKQIMYFKGVSYFISALKAESYPVLYKRALGFIKEIKKKYHSEHRIVIVAHGEIGKMIEAICKNLPWMKVLESGDIFNAEIIKLKINN